ncbi:MAG: hypothetical protein ACRD36_09895, partial [Candidatus Acidiferrum sp.]
RQRWAAEWPDRLGIHARGEDLTARQRLHLSAISKVSWNGWHTSRLTPAVHGRYNSTHQPAHAGRSRALKLEQPA